LRKLRQYFLDDIEQERAVLRSFAEGRAAFAVTSFRVARLRESLEKDLRALKDGGSSRGDPARPRGSSRGGSLASGSFRLSRSQTLRSMTLGDANREEEMNPFTNGHKQELRRRRRLARDAEWRAFNATKPDAEYENPEDVAAIEVAKKTFGNHILKSDPNHVVREERSVTYDSKREQMVFLEASARDARREFNASFFELRETRAKVVRETLAGASRIAEITAELGDAASPEGAEALAVVDEPFRAAPFADEYPTESREKVTDAELAAFVAARKAAAAAAAEKEAAKASGGFGGGGTEKEDAGKTKARVEDVSDSKPPNAARREGVDERSFVFSSERGDAANAAGGEDATDSERAARTFRLRHERSVLVRNRRALTDRFDDALRAMRRAKSFVEGELKTAETRLLKYNRELASLQKFKEGEESLRRKLAAKYAEQDDIVEKSHDIAACLEDSAVELENVALRKSKVLRAFDTIVDEEHSRREYLNKIFLRRIKRKKDLSEDPRGEDGGERSDSEYDSDDDDDDEYNSDDEMEESRPDDCDETLWDQILALRERRQDQDDVMNDLAKSDAEYKKQSDVLAKRAKSVGKALAQLQEAMFAFQREKQEAMNAIELTVPLRLRQVEYLYDGKLPNRLNQSVVFSRTTLEGLNLRADALVREKAALRETQRDLRRDHASLRRDTDDLTAKNRSLRDAATRMTMLRFGKPIDLEKLERAMLPKKGIEEVKVSLRELESANREELKRWEADVNRARAELTKTTAENTAVLHAVADLTQRKRELEVRLKHTQQSVFVDPAAARIKEAEERDRLAAVVNARAVEIEALREEIRFFSVKGEPTRLSF
jgi:hypothetical protein